VGDFSVSAAVDRTEVKANEALTLTVKIEGRGNISAIEDPKRTWPAGIDLYESKGRSVSGKGGVGQRVFEYLLIPRSPGEFSLPALEYVFFDPKKKEYVTQRTEPIRLRVQPGDPALAVSSPSGAGAQERSSPSAGQTAPPQQPMGFLKPEDFPQAAHAVSSGRSRLVGAAEKLIPLLSALVLMGALFPGLRKRWQKGSGRPHPSARLKESDFEALKSEAKKVSHPEQARALCDRLEAILLDRIEQNWGIAARALPRREIRSALLEQGVEEGLWQKTEEVLDLIDSIRFGGSSQFHELSRAVTDVRMIEGRLGRRGAAS
jgi:hypothetical protein